MLCGTFDIFPEYQYIILNVVYDELGKHTPTRKFIDNCNLFFKEKLKTEKFAPQGESRKEYMRLLRTLGRGESACMVYCRDHQDVLGSSNLRDIKEYCAKNQITYLTTLDFLYHAYRRKVMTVKECEMFIGKVLASGSKLPKVDIEHYVCDVQI